MSYKNEEGYLLLLKEVLENGNDRVDRTGVGTLSLFGKHLEFDLIDQFPIITTKKVAIKTSIRELLWMLSGQTDSIALEKQGVNIWKGNSSKEFLDKIGLNNFQVGDCGKIYGHQYRRFGADYLGAKEYYPENWNNILSKKDEIKDNIFGFDQLQYILKLLTEDPFSRRIYMSTWNPNDFKEQVLPPCHVSAQFYVEEIDNVKYLSCHMYQRSADLPIGEVFNILNYSLLTYILAVKTDMVPKKLYISLGDSHIYKNQIDAVKLQLLRTPYKFPKIKINSRVKNKTWEELEINDFEIIDYQYHPAIKMEMAI